MSYREGRFWQPDVTVATVVVSDGRLLMVEESVGGRLVLNQPAGHLEPDESLVEAALRETLEEGPLAWSELRRKLPFEAEFAICDASDLIQLEIENPFKIGF